MINRELERRYMEMKLTYKNLINANVELLDENKILKDEIERLQFENKKLQTILRTRARQDRKRKAKVRKYREELTNQRLKLERLNNIINELEKWLKENQILYGINQQGFSWGVCGEALDKLQELKGGDKE